MALPTDKQARKERPIARGVLDYFPDAIAAVANVSFVGNQQHNPGEEMHWSRGKSADHADCIARHLIERGTVDEDGVLHSAKLAWRAMALLQIEIEEGQKARGNDNCRDGRSVYEQKHGLKAGEGKMPIEEFRERFIAHAGEPFFSTQNQPQDFEEPAEGLTFNNVPIEYVETLDPTVPFAPELAPVYTIDVPTAPHAVGYSPGCPDCQNSREVRRAAARDEPSYRAEHSEVNYALMGLGCHPRVAKTIALGTTFNYDASSYTPGVYVAGPMRGYEQFNFPAFDAARDRLSTGYFVISPADIDRNSGDTDETAGTHAAVTTYVYRDFYALYYLAHTQGGGSIAMLPGWEKSTGAVAEFFLARWLGLKIRKETGELLQAYDVDDHALLMSLYKFLNDQKE